MQFKCYCGFETNSFWDAEQHGKYLNREAHGLPKIGKIRYTLEGISNGGKLCFVCGKEARFRRSHGPNGWTESFTCQEHVAKRAQTENKKSSPFMPFVLACMKK